MNNDTLERHLRRALNQRPPALDEATRKVARLAAIDAATTHHGTRRPRRMYRRPVVVGAAALTLAAGAAGGTVAYLHNGGDIGDTPAARQQIADTPALAFGPWFHQPEGSPHLTDTPERPSLAFPPGTTYHQALSELLGSVKTTGTIPTGTTLADPLPAGKVILQPAEPHDGLRLDLRAPFGYALPSGRILPSSFTHPASTPPSDVAQSLTEWAANGRVGIPRGATIDTPQLRDCMILNRAAPTPTCNLDD